MLEQQITGLQHWREQLSQTITDYRDWLDTTQTSDALQDLRLYDMEETLKKDRLVLAFVAEFSRGKTETINALFFSGFGQRLLPCDPGRTTMCPTEIFWDGNEEPCIKLLPIETRKRDDGLAYLKTNSNEWTKLRLDISSAVTMKEALHVLAQQKEVSLDEARNLGLWDDSDTSMVQALATKGKVDIPVWRHALINFPHPLLKSGLVILDTPGLNTLGTEPELTLSIIPNAHAVIFLLATDTGVTKSDMHIWTQYIRNRTSRKLAVLNKIDILWDEMKTAEEIDAMIQSQVELTAHQLSLPPSSVLAISAQKALLAKIRKDEALLQRSGIGKVEHLLAENVVAAKHEILRNTVVSETSTMVKASRKMIQQRIVIARAHLDELLALRGQNRDIVQSLLLKVTADRKLYEASASSFNQGHQQISTMGGVLLHRLNPQYLDVLLKKSKEEIGDSWTTMGLNRSMKNLIKHTTALAEQITQQEQEIKKVADRLYQLFHSKHGFEKRTPPTLAMEYFVQSMKSLEKITETFCTDPINVMTEKHFLVRKFFLSLGSQVQAIFVQTHKETNHWLHNVLAPLEVQMSEYKTALEKRTESLMQIHENLDALQGNTSQLENELAALQHQSVSLDQLLLKLMTAAKPTTATAETSMDVSVAIV